VRSLQKPGLAVVDSGNVEISNIEITNFCIGVLLLRSHDNHVHHNTIHHTSGAAGVLVTGDDGTAAGGSTTGLSTRNLIEFNTIYETGDGMECTRGTTSQPTNSTRCSSSAVGPTCRIRRESNALAAAT